jgi:hypothetical protein
MVDLRVDELFNERQEMLAARIEDWESLKERMRSR